jgi:hypothetical protein
MYLPYVEYGAILRLLWPTRIPPAGTGTRPAVRATPTPSDPLVPPPGLRATPTPSDPLVPPPGLLPARCLLLLSARAKYVTPAVTPSGFPCQPQTRGMLATCDIVIRGGTVVDGTGVPPYIADVAVKDGTIVEVGPTLTIQGDREVDATGKYVTPGWVDPHTHYDAQVMWDPMVSPSSANGVTTVVMGNCAVGIAPCQEPLRGFVTDLCDAIEDIPAKSIDSLESFWEWETFPEYMAVMEQRAFACDVGVLVGHAAVRTWVLGARANASDLCARPLLLPSPLHPPCRG